MERKHLDALKQFSPKGFVRKRIWQSDNLHCNIYCFEPGQQNSMHHHPVSDEVVLCWEGKGTAVVGRERFELAPKATLFVPAGTPHGYVNTSHTDRMVITVMQCPQPVAHVPDEPGDVALLAHAAGAGGRP